MAQQTQQLKVKGVAMVTLNASVAESSTPFTRGTAGFVSVTSDAAVYVAFDQTAVVGDPSIYLAANDTIDINDCNFSTIHAITAAGAAVVRCAYAYLG